jgi:succinyl-diaminopimelate desuccinylase
MEPTANTLQLGCVGSLHASVTVHGRAGHSARPWEGVNAITAAAPLLARFAAWAPRPSAHGGLTFFDTLTITQARGGASRNSVPASCSFNVNRRFVPGTDSATALADLRAFVGDEATVELIDSCESAAVVEASPLLDRLIAAGDLERAAKQAWTDVAQLAERGIPGVNFGPGDPAWAHQAGERVRRSDLRKSLAVMTQWLCA